MYASFQMFAVAPVVFINVLDPKRHKKDNAEKQYTVVNKQVTLDEDVYKGQALIGCCEWRSREKRLMVGC